jgi:hypothetical protein
MGKCPVLVLGGEKKRRNSFIAKLKSNRRNSLKAENEKYIFW